MLAGLQLVDEADSLSALDLEMERSFEDTEERDHLDE